MTFPATGPHTALTWRPGLRLQAVLNPLVISGIGAAATPVAPPVEQGHPVESSRAGSVFVDRFDPALRWYLPDAALADQAGAAVGEESAAFGFAATAQGVDAESGLQFDQATLTLPITLTRPADVAAAAAADPTLVFRQIDLDPISATLTCPAKDKSGADRPLVVALTVTRTSDATLQLSTTLVGASVVVVYQALAHGDASTIQLVGSYPVWRTWHPIRRVPLRPDARWLDNGLLLDIRDHRTAALQPQVVRVPALGMRPASLPAFAVDRVRLRRFDVLTADRPLADLVEPAEPAPRWLSAVDDEARVLALGAVFGTDAYRSRFTISADPTGSNPRPVIDAGDLTDFASARSEFRELTSLGDVSTRYRSLRRLYFGQVGATVVAVPQSYGIVRGSTGLAALLQAVADDSPTPAASGCRFELSFTLAPLVDPADLAALARDLAATPEGQGRTLQLTLPDSLDPRFPSAFTGFSASTSAVSDGARPGLVNVRVTITDMGQTPAICSVNLFLNQLAGTVTPLTGSLALRLDDVYSSEVRTSFVLALAETVGTDDVSLLSDGAGGVSVQNAGPLDLRVREVAGMSADGLVRREVSEPLAAGAAIAAPALDMAPVSLVRAELALPDPMPRSALFDFLTVHSETVSQVQHSLLYNAVFGFADAGVRQLDVAVQLVDLPGNPVPPATLTDAHRTDFVHATVPLDAIVTGLSAVVTVTVTPVSGDPRTVVLRHDFLAEPILVLTSNLVLSIAATKERGAEALDNAVGG